MKKPFFYIIFSIHLFCHILVLGQGVSLCWTTNSIGVAFSDSTLNATAKNAIVSDLQNCFNGWGTDAKIMLRVKENSVGYMYYGTVNPYYREGIKFPQNIIIDHAISGLALQVPKALSDAYTNAFAFVAANANIVTAAYEFVSFISSSNFVHSVTSNTIHNYVLYKDVPISIYARDFPFILNSVFQYPAYYKPSALGFYYSPEGPSATNLCLVLPSKTETGYGTPEWGGYPAIWHNGRWKVCIWDDWCPGGQ